MPNAAAVCFDVHSNASGVLSLAALRLMLFLLSARVNAHWAVAKSPREAGLSFAISHGSEVDPPDTHADSEPLSICRAALTAASYSGNQPIGLAMYEKPRRWCVSRPIE